MGNIGTVGASKKEKTTTRDVNLVGWNPAKSKQSKRLWVALIQSSAVGYHPINHCLLDAFAISRSAEWWRNTDELMACWAQASPVPVMWSWDRPLLPNYKPSSDCKQTLLHPAALWGLAWLFEWRILRLSTHSLPLLGWENKAAAQDQGHSSQAHASLPVWTTRDMFDKHWCSVLKISLTNSS